MVWPILPSLQACPGSNFWSFSGWSLAPCVTPSPRLASASVLRGEATGHLPQAARDPGILTPPPLAVERRPQLLPAQGARPGPLCPVPQSCWSLGSRRGLAGRQGSVQVQGSARTTQVGSGHRAGAAVGAARGSLERGRLAGLGLDPGHPFHIGGGHYSIYPFRG